MNVNGSIVLLLEINRTSWLSLRKPPGSHTARTPAGRAGTAAGAACGRGGSPAPATRTAPGPGAALGTRWWRAATPSGAEPFAAEWDYWKRLNIKCNFFLAVPATLPTWNSVLG